MMTAKGSFAFSDGDTYTIRVLGPDRARFLDGMLSNDVAGTAVGTSCWAVKATNKGRVEGLIRVRVSPEDIFLDVAEAAAGRVAEALSQYLVADDCELEDVTPDREVVVVFGVDAEEVLDRIYSGAATPLKDGQFISVGPDVLVADRRFDAPVFELHVPPGQASERLTELEAQGVAPSGRGAFEVLRITSGVPRDGAELTLDRLPMEARLGGAINTRKGCYVGQEVITRATTRGGVRHLLVGLQGPSSEGGDPSTWVGAQLRMASEDKAVGEVTSAARATTGPGSGVALGFVRKEHAEPGTQLRARSSDGTEVSLEVRATRHTAG